MPRPPAATGQPTAPHTRDDADAGGAAAAAVISAAAAYGRVAEDGTVYVRTTDGERSVGSWQAGDAAAGLVHFARRYADLVVEVELLERRLASGKGDPKATRSQAGRLRGTLGDASVIGDLDAVERRLAEVVAAAESVAAEQAARRREEKQHATEAKEALVVEAEAIATADGAWKAHGDRLRVMVDEWRSIKGVDRGKDEALWQRFRAARDGFTRRRGSHFATLDQQRDQVREAKERLIAEAERLATSTEWGPTANRLKTLMTEWKSAGRAQRAVDDELWTRFRAAQDAFFAARSESFGARDAEERENQQKREALIAEVGALDPTRDPVGARNALRRLQDRYDDTGHVPREAMSALDARMRAAEQRVLDAGDGGRPKAPENPLLTKMREAVTKAETALEKARAAGDPGRIADAEAALQARREWLREAEQSAC